MEYRGYNIVTDSFFKKIEPIGRGSVHMSLRGMFTSEGVAKKAIDSYEGQFQKEVEPEKEVVSVKKNFSRRSK